MYLFGAFIILVFAVAFLVTGIEAMNKRKFAESGMRSDQLTATGIGCFVLFLLSVTISIIMTFISFK